MLEDIGVKKIHFKNFRPNPPIFCIAYEQGSRKTILDWGCGENICCSKMGEGRDIYPVLQPLLIKIEKTVLIFTLSTLCIKKVIVTSKFIFQNS